MARSKMKIAKPYRIALYIIIGLSWVTGSAFFIFNNFIMVESDFGPAKHPLQFQVIKIHGLSASLVLMGL